jgi:YfiH family protein
LKGQRSFRFVTGGGLEWSECSRFARLPWLLHAFSTRRGGVSKSPAASLNLGFVDTDRRANVERNRFLFFKQVGAQHYSLAWLRQIHSAAGYQVGRTSGGKLEYRPSGYTAPSVSNPQVPAGDALMTDQPGVLLSVRCADCLPVLLVDPRCRAVAAVHAGWRGALQRVVEKTVGVMRSVFGSDPRRILAALGPSIRACCYSVGE